jgi:hypothetical protein
MQQLSRWIICILGHGALGDALAPSAAAHASWPHLLSPPAIMRRAFAVRSRRGHITGGATAWPESGAEPPSGAMGEPRGVSRRLCEDERRWGVDRGPRWGVGMGCGPRAARRSRWPKPAACPPARPRAPPARARPPARPPAGAPAARRAVGSTLFQARKPRFGHVSIPRHHFVTILKHWSRATGEPRGV